MMRLARFSKALVPLTLLLGSGSAFGAVKLEGTWPEVDKAITLDAAGLPRSEAVRRIADAAGWNVVWPSPSNEPVDVHVKKQPATKVLELVLSDGDYIARRQGDLIKIEKETAPATLPSASAAAPAAAPAPGDSAALAKPGRHAHGRNHGDRGADRSAFGGNVRVEKDETVNDVTVLGGSADILGKVTGSVSVLGGAAELHPGAHVSGDVDVLGGELKVDDGAVIDGHVNVLGGELEKAPGAQIHGEVENGTHDHDAGDSEPQERASRRMRAARSLGGSLTRTAMLFVFGAVLVALATRRMTSLRTEVAQRPMRTFALGVVGSIGMVIVAGLLCVTLIGIPVAIVGILAAFFGAFAGICAVLEAAGGALLTRWTSNPYLHLATGCAFFLLLGFIPYVGTGLTVIVVLLGIGSLVATRAAGFIPPRSNLSAGAAQPTVGAA